MILLNPLLTEINVILILFYLLITGIGLKCYHSFFVVFLHISEYAFWYNACPIDLSVYIFEMKVHYSKVICSVVIALGNRKLLYCISLNTPQVDIVSSKSLDLFFMLCNSALQDAPLSKDS